MRTSSADQRLRLLGQLDLGAAAEVMTGETYWSIQKRIATAISKPRAKVAVPSCNASGKTWLAARLALAFYNAFTPGTPCVQCGGPCRGAKVITTSSKEDHLKMNLWGEIRNAHPKIQERGIIIPGRLWDGDMRLEENKNHFIIGQSAASAEGFQGYHAAHKLIIGDEATSVDDEVKLAITRLMASSDTRLLLIYNPTTPDTYASQQNRSPRVVSIPITAFDTPAWTGEPMPPGANLITPAFLEDLKASGMGPGTFEWETSVMAKDWDLGDDLLIPPAWYQARSNGRVPILGTGTRQLGVDIAAYGSDENVIAFRDGGQLIDVKAFPSMRTDAYVQGPVTKAVLDFAPDVIVFDGDGVGAGAVGYFEDLKRLMRPGGMVIPFRGGKGHPGRFINQRSAWYWSMRRRFESGSIDVAVQDDKLQEQITDIHYTVTPQGEIRVETKGEMRKRGMRSPDRADGVMYAFAYSDDFPLAGGAPITASDILDLPDHSDKALWERMIARSTEPRVERNPVLDAPDDW